MGCDTRLWFQSANVSWARTYRDTSIADPITHVSVVGLLSNPVMYSSMSLDSQPFIYNTAHDSTKLPPHALPDIPSSPEVSTHNISLAIMASPRLPGELCDSVIDELGHWETLNIHGVTEWYTGSQALKQCALVCRE